MATPKKSKSKSVSRRRASVRKSRRKSAQLRRTSSSTKLPRASESIYNNWVKTAFGANANLSKAGDVRVQIPRRGGVVMALVSDKSVHFSTARKRMGKKQRLLNVLEMNNVRTGDESRVVHRQGSHPATNLLGFLPSGVRINDAVQWQKTEAFEVFQDGKLHHKGKAVAPKAFATALLKQFHKLQPTPANPSTDDARVTHVAGWVSSVQRNVLNENVPSCEIKFAVIPTRIPENDTVKRTRNVRLYVPVTKTRATLKHYYRRARDPTPDAYCEIWDAAKCTQDKGYLGVNVDDANAFVEDIRSVSHVPKDVHDLSTVKA